MVKQTRIMPTISALCACLLWTASCSLAGAQTASPVVLSDVARNYLESVITLAQTNSINRSRIDWPMVRREVFSRAGSAQTPSDTHAAVQWLVSALGDRHSAFRDPVALKSLPARTAAVSGKPEGRVVDGRFGYVLVPTFGSPDQASIDQFATDLQGVISSVGAFKPCGWVVDLRSNGGGNMWPMLAGIGPVMGSGRLGSFRDPDGRGGSAGSSLGRADDSELWRGHRDCVPWPSVDAFVWGNDTRVDNLKPCVPSLGRLVAELDDCRFRRSHRNAIPKWRDARRALERPT